MAKKVLRYTEEQFIKLLENIVKKVKVNETRDYPIKRTVGHGEHDRYSKYARGTQWTKGLSNYGENVYEKHIENFGPMTIYFSPDDSIKLATYEKNPNVFYDQNGRELSRFEAEELLGYSLDTISESRVNRRSGLNERFKKLK